MRATIVGSAALILALFGSVIACERHENPKSPSIDLSNEPEILADVCQDNEAEDTKSWRFRVVFTEENEPVRMRMNGTRNDTKEWSLCPSSKVTWLASREFAICFDKDGTTASPFDAAGTCFDSKQVGDKHRLGPMTVRVDAKEQKYNYRVCYKACNGTNPQWDPVIIVEK